MLEAPATSQTSSLGKAQNLESNLSEKEVKFATNNVRISSSHDSFQSNIFDFDKIICAIIIVIGYLFVALEEADYQILSASCDANSEDIISNDSWSLGSVLSLFRR